MGEEKYTMKVHGTGHTDDRLLLLANKTPILILSLTGRTCETITGHLSHIQWKMTLIFKNSSLKGPLFCISVQPGRRASCNEDISKLGDRQSLKLLGNTELYYTSGSSGILEGLITRLQTISILLLRHP